MTTSDALTLVQLVISGVLAIVTVWQVLVTNRLNLRLKLTEMGVTHNMQQLNRAREITLHLTRANARALGMIGFGQKITPLETADIMAETISLLSELGAIVTILGDDGLKRAFADAGNIPDAKMNTEEVMIQFSKMHEAILRLMAAEFNKQ